MSDDDDYESIMTINDYEAEANEKSCENYDPYSYVEDMQDPVYFDQETITDWYWE